MRYKEFLLEYRRDVTAQKMGDRLLQAFIRIEKPTSIPDVFYNPWTVTDMVMRPERYDDRKYNVVIFGNRTIISRDTAAQVLEQIKPKLVDVILEQLEQGDPTPHKEYSQWIAARYITGDTKLEDIGSTLREYLYKFNILKRKKLLKPPANDINRYNSFGNLMDNMDEYELPEDEIVNKGNVTEVYEDADVRVVVPEDQTAACYYGQGTRWCTASTRGTNYYNHYARQGPLYILLPKKAIHEGEKYQLHFPSEQFMDEDDTDEPLFYLLTERFPNLENFFKQQEPSLNGYIMFTDSSDMQKLLDKVREISLDAMWDEVTEWEAQDDYWTQWQAEQARELGYVDADGDIDWDKVHEDDALNNYLEYNDELSRMVDEIKVALDYSPDNIKNFIINDQDGEARQYVNADLAKLSDVVGDIINYETGNRRRDNNFAADYAYRHIDIRRNTMRIHNTDPEWKVTRV